MRRFGVLIRLVVQQAPEAVATVLLSFAIAAGVVIWVACSMPVHHSLDDRSVADDVPWVCTEVQAKPVVIWCRPEGEFEI